MKTKLQTKNGDLDEEKTENGYLYSPFCQKTFYKSKSLSLNVAHDQ